jgi:hypothetical protein
MQIKHSIVAILAAMVLPFSVQAQEFETDPAVMAYYQMNFGADDRKRNLSFAGMRLDMRRVSTEGPAIDFSSHYNRTPLVDLQVDELGPRAMKFNGVNALQRTVTHNAAEGKDETESEIQWGIVFGGIIGACLIWCRGDGDNDDDNRRREMMSECQTPTFAVKEPEPTTSQLSCTPGFEQR